MSARRCCCLPALVPTLPAACKPQSAHPAGSLHAPPLCPLLRTQAALLQDHTGCPGHQRRRSLPPSLPPQADKGDLLQTNIGGFSTPATTAASGGVNTTVPSASLAGAAAPGAAPTKIKLKVKKEKKVRARCMLLSTGRRCGCVCECVLVAVVCMGLGVRVRQKCLLHAHLAIWRLACWHAPCCPQARCSSRCSAPSFANCSGEERAASSCPHSVCMPASPRSHSAEASMISASSAACSSAIVLSRSALFLFALLLPCRAMLLPHNLGFLLLVEPIKFHLFISRLR